MDCDDRRFERRQHTSAIIFLQQQSKSSSLSLMLMLVLLSALVAEGFFDSVHHVHGFSLLSLPTRWTKIYVPAKTSVKFPSPIRKLYASAPADDEDEEDEEDEDDEDDSLMDDSSLLGDWRKFRASLIDGGLPITTSAPISSSSDDSSDSSNGDTSTQETKPGKQPAKKTTAAATTTKRKSVAAQNEALLEQQSQSLALEYKTGVWCHVIQEPEVGGLLCRMPLEAELYHGSSSSSTTSSTSSSSATSASSASSTESSYWKDKLRLMVSLENGNGNITSATSALLASTTSTQLDSDDDSMDDEATTEAKVKQ
jgi:hypothetical protein